MAGDHRHVEQPVGDALHDNVPAGEPLLGTSDIQSLADLANAVSVVKGMRWITIGPRLLTMMMIAAVAPLTPLIVVPIFNRGTGAEVLLETGGLVMQLETGAAAALFVATFLAGGRALAGNSWQCLRSRWRICWRLSPWPSS